MNSLRMFVTSAIAVSVTVGLTALESASPITLSELVASGEWRKVLEVASRRQQQLPLSAEDAMLAAYASRMLGEASSEASFLAAGAVSGSELGRLADVQLAALTVRREPGKAIDHVVPAFDRRLPWAVRRAATEVAVDAVGFGLEDDKTKLLEAARTRLSRSLRRSLDLALAIADSDRSRSRLERLLAASTADTAALSAAEVLAAYAEPSAVERWRVASTWYRHAMYDRASAVLEDLALSGDDDVPTDEVMFLRGRCAFRLGRWREAASWYTRAVSAARGSERRAGFEVHLGRALELAGDLDGAVEAALRAVRAKTTDERRLFLARLRLRRGEVELAAAGLSHLRARSSRDRASMMLAVDELRRSRGDTARSYVERVHGPRWSGPAAVLAASLAAGNGQPDEAIEVLDRSAASLRGLWVDQARDVMSMLPPGAIDGWRNRQQREVAAASDRSRTRVLSRWAALEPSPEVRRQLRDWVESEHFPGWREATHEFRPGLAAQLWRLGLDEEAARWDPAGFPKHTAAATAWSARLFLDVGLPWRSIRTADAAWRQAAPDLPSDVLPVALQEALFPMPRTQTIAAAAAAAGVDWALLAAVAREESRWDPEALSSAGARGLLQLMPATAVVVASSLGRSEPSPDELFEADLNLELGATELARLLSVFDGRRAPAIAAYNAGEEQSRLWLEQCGPGCSDAVFLVNVSFSATRAYTAHVLHGAQRYRELFGTELDTDHRTPPESNPR